MLRELWRSCTKAVVSTLDIVLPRRERTRNLDNLQPGALHPMPAIHPVGERAVTVLLGYRDPLVRDCIQALKYDGSPKAARLLAAALGDYIHEEIVSWRTFSARPVVLLPVPLHPSRRRVRGFNQMERVLTQLPREMQDGTLSSVHTDLLVRTRATPQQTRLSRDERIANVADAFAVSDPEAVAHMHVVLIDDVTTTGATLAQAGRPLEEAGAIVTFLALARA